MDDGGAEHKTRRQQMVEQRQLRLARTMRRLYSHPFVDPRLPHGPHGRPPSPSAPRNGGIADGDDSDRSHITWAVFNNLVSEQLGIRPQSAAHNDQPSEAFHRHLAASRAVAVKPSLNDRAFLQRLSTGHDTKLLVDNDKLEQVATDPLALPRDLHGANLVHQKVQRLQKQRRAAEKQKRAAKRARTQSASPSQPPPHNLTQSPDQTNAQPHRVTRSAAKKLATARTASQCCFCPDLSAFDGKELESELIGPFVDRRGQARLFVHFECACWAPQVYADAASGQLRRVYDEHCRGRQLKCAHCGDKGATIGCYVQRCKRVYHLRCLRISGAYTVDKFFAAFCLNHAHLGKEQTYVTLMEAATIADVAAAQRRDDTTFGLDAPHSRYTLLRRRETEVIFSRKWKICSHTSVFDSTKILFSHKRRKIISRRDKLCVADRVKALPASAIDIASGRLAYLTVLGEDAPRDDAAAFQVRAALASRDVSNLLLLRNLRRAPEWKKEDIEIVKKLVPPVDRSQSHVSAAKNGEREANANSIENGRSSRPNRPVQRDSGDNGSAKDAGRSPKRARTASPNDSKEARAAGKEVIQTIPLRSARLPPINRNERNKEKDEICKSTSPSSTRETIPVQEKEKGIEHITSTRPAADAFRDSQSVTEQDGKPELPCSPQVPRKGNKDTKMRSAWKIFLERQLPKERKLRPQDSLEDSMKSMARLWSLLSPTEREEYEQLARQESVAVREGESVPGQDHSRQRKSIVNVKGRYNTSSHTLNVSKAGLFVKSNVAVQNLNNASISAVPYAGASGKQQSKSLPPIRRRSLSRTDAQHVMDWDELFPTSLRGILPGKVLDGSEGSRLVPRVRPPPGHGKSVT